MQTQVCCRRKLTTRLPEIKKQSERFDSNTVTDSIVAPNRPALFLTDCSSHQSLLSITMLNYDRWKVESFFPVNGKEIDTHEMDNINFLNTFCHIHSRTVKDL